MDDFQRLYEQYSKRIYYYLIHLCGNDKTAEDLMQETFYKVLVYICGRKDLQVSTGWLLRIAHNAFIDHIRKNKINAESLDNLVIEPGQHMADVAYKIDFSELLLKLPLRYRSILLLRDHYGFSYEDITRIMNCSESAVKVTLHRARERFKEVYKEYERQTPY